MGTIVSWIIVFLILCGCLFAWSYMLHRGPHAGENDGLPSCDGDCLHCAKNTAGEPKKPKECDEEVC